MSMEKVLIFSWSIISSSLRQKYSVISSRCGWETLLEIICAIFICFLEFWFHRSEFYCRVLCSHFEKLWAVWEKYWWDELHPDIISQTDGLCLNNKLTEIVFCFWLLVPPAYINTRSNWRKKSSKKMQIMKASAKPFGLYL